MTEFINLLNLYKMSTYLDLKNYSCERVGISYFLAKRMSDISLFLLIIVINGQKLWKNLLCFLEGLAKFKNLQVGSEVEEEEFSYLLPISDSEDNSAHGGADGDCN